MSPPTGLRIFLSCWLLYSLHFATDIVREHYPAFSLAERGTLRVDPYLGLHPDLFRVEGRGAFIDNNPGTSMLAAIPYALLRPAVDAVVERVARRRAATGHELSADYDDPRPNRRRFFRQVRQRGLDVRFGLAAGIIQLGYTAPLSALGAWVMWLLLGRLGFAKRPALLLAALYAFGTPVFFRSGFLNQNLTVAHLGLFAFALLFDPSERAPSRRRLLGAGLLAGWCVVCDYSGLVSAAALGGYALARLHRSRPAGPAGRGAAALCVGGLASAAVLLGYQAWAFGNPLLPAQRLMPPTPLSGAGWSGLQLPAPDLLWKNLADPRFGLFVAGPVLLLAFGAPRRSEAERPALAGPERWLAVGLPLLLLLFASSISYARLQWNTGVRYLIPAVPFLFLLAATTLVRLPQRLALAIGVLALFQSWALAMVRDAPLQSLVTVCSSGLQLPWLSVLGRMGGQYLPLLASRPPDPTALLGLAAALLTVLWWPLQRRAQAYDGRP